MKVFISWSGQHSKKLGEVLRDWLPGVLQLVTPYFTPSDIEKGTRWSTDIAKELSASQIDRATKQLVKIPLAMYEEIIAGREDDLTRWLKDNREALLLDETVAKTLVARVTDHGYVSDLTGEELERVGRDPFLIAYALRNPAQRTVVTTEVSKPTKQRANRHIPDVCDDLHVFHCNTYQFIAALDFTTGRRS